MSSSDRPGEPAGSREERGDRPAVLVVEDHRELVDLYRLWLDDWYDVLAVHDGVTARNVLAGARSSYGPETAAVEAVLLDRRLGGESGTDQLAGLRVAAPDVTIALVSALEPDLDVAAARPDAYLEKPVSKRSLRATIEYLRALRGLEEAERRVLSARATARAVEATVPPTVRERSAAYRRLVADGRGGDAGPGDGGDPGEAVAAAVARALGTDTSGSEIETDERFYHGCPRTTCETRGTRI